MLFQELPERAKLYFTSGLQGKAQQIEAERAVECQHAVYTLASDFFDVLPVYFIHQEDLQLLQDGTRQGIFLDTFLNPQRDLVCIEKYIVLAEIGRFMEVNWPIPTMMVKPARLLRHLKSKRPLSLRISRGNNFMGLCQVMRLSEASVKKDFKTGPWFMRKMAIK